MAQGISDDQRRRLEQALAAALLLIYSGEARRALVQLGIAMQALHIPPEARQRIDAFAADRAQKIQDGINQRMDAQDDAPDAMEQAHREIGEYNAATLIPFLTSWATHQGRIDTYRSQPDPGGSGMTAADATPWVWTQHTDFLDDCTEAMGASPASYDELTGIAGGEPPVHSNCACTLEPA